MDDGGQSENFEKIFRKGVELTFISDISESLVMDEREEIRRLKIRQGEWS
jgi:hypothetical protein